MYEPSVTQWMCLCFPHCDSTHCELHCYHQLSLILKTGISLYADGTQIIEVGLSLTVQERRKEKNETERKNWHHSDRQISVSSVGLDAGVYLISTAVLSLSSNWIRTKHMHAQTHTNTLCSPVKTNIKPFSLTHTDEEMYDFSKCIGKHQKARCKIKMFYFSD